MFYKHNGKNYEKWILAAILIVAFIFRFQDITSIPPGLYPDEAINGNNALVALETGDYKIFYPDNNGREGLFINVQAQFLRVFGPEPWALRTVSAVFGLLTVLGLYFLVRLFFLACEFFANRLSGDYGSVFNGLGILFLVAGTKKFQIQRFCLKRNIFRARVSYIYSFPIRAVYNHLRLACLLVAN